MASCLQIPVFEVIVFQVYIGTEVTPLHEEEEVNLASGCLVTFMRSDRLPCHANDLQYRLQFPDTWHHEPRFPIGPAIRSSLLLLHSSGRYLYRPQATHDPGDVSAARFVGVDRAAVDFHTPGDGGLERVMYRGIRVRGVLALADHLFSPQFVVFLDLRQVAEGVQFVVLDVPFILLVHLVENATTLTFSFQYACNSESSETPFDPTTDSNQDADDDSGDDSSADAHLEVRPDHPQTTLTKAVLSALAWLTCAHAARLRGTWQPHTIDALSFPAFQAALHAKLLSEPASDNRASRERLHALRSATEQLGGEWRYFTPTTRLHAGLSEYQDPSSDEDQEAQLRRASFVICVPGYAPEFLVLEVTFPTTHAELTPILRRGRQADRDQRFPHLVPASPQPIDGTGLFLAAPHWHHDVRVVCIDATRLDGRLYATVAPAYADRDTLIDLAGAHGFDVAVYAGLGQEPVPEGTLIHLTAGTTITVLAVNAAPPMLWDLGQWLLDASQWSSRPLLAYPEPSDAYCLVREAHHQLFRADPSRPTLYRRRLAAAVDAPEDRILVTPAAPRVTDIDIAGTPCRTAVAVSVRSQDHVAGHRSDVLVDGRPVLEGWFLWPVHSGRLFTPDLLAHFRHQVPLGYTVHIQHEPQLGVTMPVHEGMVIVVDFAPAVQAAPITATNDAAAGQAVASQRRVHFAPDSLPSAPDAPPAGGLPSTSSRNDLVPDVSPSAFRAAFLVFAPSYLPEYIELNLHAPATLQDALDEAQAKRLPAYRDRFPQLLAVNPQPDMAYGTLLAAPAWPLSEALVYFDLRGVDDRYFALNVPVRMTFGSLLTVADLPATSDVLIYIRDIPWPLGQDFTIELTSGDLILFARPDHAIAVHASLPDMLQQPVGWTPEPDIPGEFGDRIWLVTDHEPVLYEVNRNRLQAFRQDIAAALDISSNTLRLQPVWPSILTFAAHGLLVRSVLIAVDPPPIPNDGTESWIVCLLDLRPILLGLVAAYAPDGKYDISGLCRRLQGFCPRGFEVSVSGGHSRANGSPDTRTVFAGEVLQVSFVAAGSVDPADARGDAPPSPNGPNTHDAGPASSSHPDTRLGGSGAAPRDAEEPRATSSPPRPAGGQARRLVASHCVAEPDVPCNTCSVTTSVGIVQLKWRPGTFHNDTLPPGTRDLTPVLPFPSVPQGSSKDPFDYKRPPHASTSVPKCFRLLLLAASLCVQPGATVQLPAQSHALPVPQGTPVWTPAAPQETGKPPLAFQGHAEEDGRTRPPFRPIPTPCRVDKDSLPPLLPGAPCCRATGPSAPLALCDHSAVQPATHDGSQQDDDPGDLVTLLWESVQDPECQAFMLASTLLDTCLDHFGELGFPPPKLCLVLDAQIPAPTPGLAQPSCSFWSQLDVPLACFPWVPAALPGLSSLSLHEHLTIGPYHAPCTVQHIRDFLLPNCTLGTGWDIVLAIQQKDLQKQRALDLCPRDFESSDLHCFTDGSYSAATPPWALIDDRPSAYVAECYALVAAAWLSLTCFSQVPTVLRSDCTSAIGVFQGRFVGAPTGVAAVLRSLGLFGAEFSPHPPRAVHVAGHQGCLGNELADCLARSAALGRTCGHLSWSHDLTKPWWFQSGSALSWAAIAVASLSARGVYPGPASEAMPPCDDFLGLEPIQLVAPFLPDEALSTGQVKQHTWGQLSMRVCSFNVLSLNSATLEGTAADGLAFQPARPTLLAESLKAAGVHIALLQEARTQEGMLRTHGHLRYASGSLNGTLGVEVWLLENHPLFCGPRGQAKLHLSSQACLVLHRDPRRILLLFRQDGFSLLVASVHAPHRAVEQGVIAAWWAETHRLCNVHAHSALLLLGGDMNASLGSVTCAAVGNHDPIRLWVPSTFPFCQHGPSGTYVQKRNGAMSRIDFIACPSEWRSGQISTWTDETLHTGQAYIDHLATCAHFDLTVCLAGRLKKAQKRRFDGRAILAPAGQAHVERILRDAPRIPWAASPHAHAATLVQYLQTELASAFPPQKGRRFRPYLSDNTWALHREVARLRKHCVSIKRALAFHLQAAVFQAWKQGDGSPLLHMLNSAWTQEALFAGAAQSHFLSVSSQRLKAACKQDRAAHFSSLADDVQQDRPHASKAVQRLMGLRRKKPFRPEVLPALCIADGNRCRTPEEVTSRWREHFREQEDGYDISPASLANLGAMSGPTIAPVSLGELPSPDILLQVIASSQKGKAPGPDGLPAEVGHASPQGLVKLLMPLLLKLGLTCVEPIGFKGGTLTKLYKGRGDTAHCASYRAIMLLPTLAKFLHKAFRPGLYDVFQSNATPAQLGGLKNTSVVLGSHITRAFCRFCAAEGLTSVLLFADVASAYYTAVRALTARKGQDEETTDAVYRPDKEHLAAELSKPSAMAQADASPWIESLTAELNSSTWMCLAGDVQPVVTRQGSRPGSSFADLFYGVTVPRMLQWRDSARSGSEASLPAVEHAPTVRWDGRFDFSEPSRDPATWTSAATLDDVIWADDLAKCIVVHEAQCVAAATAFECGILADAFYAHGYELSFGPTKTAAIVVPRGTGSRKVRKALFSAKPALPILREELGAASLPLVTAYRHLGVKISSSPSLMVELRHRASHAWAAFQQGRTKVFRTGRISVHKRGALLSTHVMTKLLFAAGAWPALSKGEHAFFFRTVLSLYRQTLAIPHDGDQHLTHATICALVGQPPPEILLLTERARYLLQLLNAAPVQLWALVRRDADYVLHLRGALFWVYHWVQDTSDLGHPDTHWPAWDHTMRFRPHVFKALIKRARGLEIVRTACFAAFQAVRRALGLITDSDPPPTPHGVRYQEACLQCKIAFPSRTAWACHASRLHGYRASSTVLTSGCDRPLCQSCGRLYANFGRLKRHLASSAACRTRWGAFIPSDHAPQEAHPEAPPTCLPGHRGAFLADLDPSKVHPGLLRELQGLTSLLSEDVWDVVQGYVEPLSMLKDTLEEWSRQPGRDQDPLAAAAVASDVGLLLDPELWCEDFRAPKQPSMPAVACPPFDTFNPGRLPFVLSGDEHVVTIEDPPLRAWVYPFRASVPLSAARRHLAWAEAACDVIGLTLQISRASPVRVRLSPAASACLSPIPGWLESSGFRVESGCIRSPRG
ncbi:unnamed protein product [Symbiodinium sp. CCMP2592]|nr:unnamed protein product [Symbiodinium sp. CCMP2592]